MNELSKRIIRIAKLIEADETFLGNYVGMIKNMPMEFTTDGALNSIVKDGIKKADSCLTNFDKKVYEWSFTQIRSMLVILEQWIAWFNECLSKVKADSLEAKCLTKAKFDVEKYYAELTEFGQSQYDKRKKKASFIKNAFGREPVKYAVYLWPGSGYLLHKEVVEASSEEEALEKAVAKLEKDGLMGFLMDVSETEEEAAKDGIFDPETGIGEPEFDETYMYVDATMEGASKPYYIFNENLRIEREN